MAEDTKQLTVSDIMGWLRTQRDRIDDAIAALEALAASQAESQAAFSGKPSAPASNTAGSVAIPSDAFFRMSMADAIKKYLAIVKRPKRTREITDSLLAGGLTTTSKNPAAPIYNTLLGLYKSDSGVDRLQDGTWGLSEWYPGRRRPRTKGEDGPSGLDSEAEQK